MNNSFLSTENSTEEKKVLKRKIIFSLIKSFVLPAIAFIIVLFVFVGPLSCQEMACIGSFIVGIPIAIIIHTYYVIKTIVLSIEYTKKRKEARYGSKDEYSDGVTDISIGKKVIVFFFIYIILGIISFFVRHAYSGVFLNQYIQIKIILSYVSGIIQIVLTLLIGRWLISKISKKTDKSSLVSHVQKKSLFSVLIDKKKQESILLGKVPSSFPWWKRLVVFMASFFLFFVMFWILMMVVPRVSSPPAQDATGDSSNRFFYFFVLPSIIASVILQMIYVKYSKKFVMGLFLVFLAFIFVIFNVGEYNDAKVAEQKGMDNVIKKVLSVHDIITEVAEHSIGYTICKDNTYLDEVMYLGRVFDEGDIQNVSIRKKTSDNSIIASEEISTKPGDGIVWPYPGYHVFIHPIIYTRDSVRQVVSVAAKGSSQKYNYYFFFTYPNIHLEITGQDYNCNHIYCETDTLYTNMGKRDGKTVVQVQRGVYCK